MARTSFPQILALILLPAVVQGDYACLCNYNVEKTVLQSADVNSQVLGYMYEFDCKPMFTMQAPTGFFAVQFEKRLGYVTNDPQMQIQTCPGNPPDEDLIATTAMTIQPTTLSTTTTEPTTDTTTTTPTPSTTISTTITTSTKAPTATTSSTTPLPTSTITTTPQPTSALLSQQAEITTTFSNPPISTTKHDWPIAANVSGTHYQYVGVGYNLLTGNPEAGFQTTHRILQLTGARNNIHEATYVRHTSCTPHNTTMLLHGSKAYQDELKTLVRPDMSHNTHLLDGAFTFNSHFTAMQHVLDSSRSLYIDVVTTCNLGTVRYITENATRGQFAVTREFARDVCALPLTITPSSTIQYMHFLDKWGTSIITSVDLGTKRLDRYQTTSVDIFQHVQQTDPKLLEYHGPFQGFSSSVTINTHDFGNSLAAHTPFGSHNHSVMGTRAHQVPIGGGLIPIVDVLDKNYWTTILDQLVADRICLNSIRGTDLDKYQTNFRIALNEYTGYKLNLAHQHHQTIDRQSIQVPITWPHGTYGLMNAHGGCPSNNVHWNEGWRKQDTENAHNGHTNGISNFMAGQFQSDFIITKFCMKTSANSSTGSQYDQQWPKGAYCILKKGPCPTGLTSGYVSWDDQNENNHDRHGGVLPDGTFDSNTNISYCCRNDGPPTHSILLPTDRPFILLRYGSKCQSVHGMSAHELFIKWDDEDTRNTDKLGGMHPVDDGGAGNHKLHFCFYQTLGGAVLVG